MILVCGEALIDMFVAVDHGRLALEAVAGGSPFNVARGLGRLGRSVGYVGALSVDAFGAHLAQSLRADGVDLRHTVTLDAATTLSVVSTGDAGAVRYAFHGEGCADRLMTRDRLPTSLDGISCITCGSFSLAVEPSGYAFEAFALQAATAGRVISLDPNVRPSLIQDRDGWQRRFARLIGAATIVKASEEDILHAYGAEASPLALARSWREEGVALVVITRGASPALAIGAFGLLEVPVRPVPFVDAVGAGDSFHAALLAALDQRGMLSREAIGALDGQTAGEVLGFAATAAAVTCSRRGADLPDLAAVLALS